MVIVFYSFVGSFLTTMATTAATAATAASSGKEGQGPMDIWTHVVYGIPFSSHQKSCNGRNKSIVGIIFCILSFLHLRVDMIQQQYGHYNNNNKKGAEFHALANMAGFLAFDLWYDQVCCRQYPPRVLCILGDALTLSVFSVLLSKWDDWDMGSNGMVVRPLLVVWLGYKMVRFGLDILQRHKQSIAICDCPNNDDYRDNRGMEDAKTVSRGVSEQLLWTIHGKDYDLSDFVERHPGGKEAILLGRGRDCTALYESYHPFTNRHR
jgi:Cytochrome b involved in lipid metabolism